MSDIRQKIPDETIKATAALSTDAALVVGFSPNSPLPFGRNNIGTVNIGSTIGSKTYSATISNLALAATATDVFTISGSDTYTVHITKIFINGIQTTAGQVNVVLLKRSTLNTGGTSTIIFGTPFDVENTPATAVVEAYTENPLTLGTLIGNVFSARVFMPGAATATDAQGLSKSFGDVGQQYMTLRGSGILFGINFASSTIIGGSADVTIEWTES